MEFEIRITDFFQFIFETFKEDKPEFLVVHHEFKIRHALRNLDDPTTQEVLAIEKDYGDKLTALVDTYHKVIQILHNTPEEIRPAMFQILGREVQQFLIDIGVEPYVEQQVMGVLADILNDFPEQSSAQLQAAGAVLAQITAAQTEAVAEQPEPVAEQETTTDEQPEG